MVLENGSWVESRRVDGESEVCKMKGRICVFLFAEGGRISRWKEIK